MTTAVVMTSLIVTMTLTDRLKHCRELAGLSNRELDRLAQMTESHSSMLEKSERPNPKLSTLERICSVFGCSIDWLAKGEGQGPTDAEILSAVDAARSRQKEPDIADPQPPSAE